MFLLVLPYLGKPFIVVSHACGLLGATKNFLWFLFIDVYSIVNIRHTDINMVLMWTTAIAFVM